MIGLIATLCILTWNPNPPAERVSGYWVRNNGMDTYVGLVTGAPCSTFHVLPGWNRVSVSAENAVGRGSESAVVEFHLSGAGPVGLRIERRW